MVVAPTENATCQRRPDITSASRVLLRQSQGADGRDFSAPLALTSIPPLPLACPRLNGPTARLGPGQPSTLEQLGLEATACDQQLMELEVAQHVGADKYERSADRSGERNGYRDRNWDTRVGSIELRVPRVRDGGYYPALLEPRRRGERALVAVVQETYVNGVSTRRVDDLVKALGINSMSKSHVSRLCQALDTEAERFRTRKLDGGYAYCQLDATFVKVRQDHRVVSMAIVIAVGVNQYGQREVLGLDVGPSEDGAFWHAFLRGLVARGLSGVKLVTSDPHEGLKAAIAAVLQGSSWQRCRTPFHEERLGTRAKRCAANGRRDDPNRLLPARCGQCPIDLATSGGWVSTALAQARSPPR